MSQAERRAIRTQANRFETVRQLQPKPTKQERRAKLKNVMEGIGIGWMLSKLFS